VKHHSRQVIRWIGHGEMPGLLESCGFRLERCFADFDPDSESPDPGQDDGEGIFTCHAVRLA
jgi:hypothetical protein